jgi:hypothetical protein
LAQKYYHSIDLLTNQLLNSRLHNISTADRISLGLTLTSNSKGYMVYDTTLNKPYFWDGTQWAVAGGGQSLQQVTDIGAITNNSITINSNTLGLSNLYLNSIPNTAALSVTMKDGLSRGIEIINYDSSNTFPFTYSLFDGDVNYIPLTTINDAGELTATKLIKQGGTSTQYLMADGSTSTGPSLTGYVPTSRTLTINGTGYDLTADRSWSVGTVTGVTATSPITSSGGTAPVISTSMATNKLIGRSSAGTGVMEEITVGAGLSLSGGTINATAQSVGFEQNFLLMGA